MSISCSEISLVFYRNPILAIVRTWLTLHGPSGPWNLITSHQVLTCGLVHWRNSLLCLRVRALNPHSSIQPGLIESCSVLKSLQMLCYAVLRLSSRICLPLGMGAPQGETIWMTKVQIGLGVWFTETGKCTYVYIAYQEWSSVNNHSGGWKLENSLGYLVNSKPA